MLYTVNVTVFIHPECLLTSGKGITDETIFKTLTHVYCPFLILKVWKSQAVEFIGKMTLKVVWIFF